MKHEDSPGSFVTLESLPGLDSDQFAAWARSVHPELGGITEIKPLTGGHSNLSYVMTTEVGRFVLRRPPLGHVMKTAHDMRREFRVQAALAGSNVPVPKMMFFVDAGTPNTGVDTDFYVMEFIAGIPFTDTSVNENLTPAQAHELSLETGRVLARLHDIDPKSVGLEDFGRPAGFLARQAKRWNQQLVASHSRALPKTERLGQLLLESAPEDSGSSILHGDYKLNNALVEVADETPIITALLDWEMSTLGDPLTDLAVLGVYWRMAEIYPEMAEAFDSPVDFAAGYASFDALETAYFEERKIAKPNNMPWYHALAAFKIAVITESLHYRYVTGLTVGDDFENKGNMTEPIAAEGLRQFEELNEI